jgi:hypothetical protein
MEEPGLRDELRRTVDADPALARRLETLRAQVDREPERELWHVGTVGLLRWRGDVAARPAAMLGDSTVLDVSLPHPGAPGEHVLVVIRASPEPSVVLPTAAEEVLHLDDLAAPGTDIDLRLSVTSAHQSWHLLFAPPDLLPNDWESPDWRPLQRALAAGKLPAQIVYWPTETSE